VTQSKSILGLDCRRLLSDGTSIRQESSAALAAAAGLSLVGRTPHWEMPKKLS
jgi:hypothetical protein